VQCYVFHLCVRKPTSRKSRCLRKLTSRGSLAPLKFVFSGTVVYRSILSREACLDNTPSLSPLSAALVRRILSSSFSRLATRFWWMVNPFHPNISLKGVYDSLPLQHQSVGERGWNSKGNVELVYNKTMAVLGHTNIDVGVISHW
jgi:hypothetical protein